MVGGLGLACLLLIKHNWCGFIYLEHCDQCPQEGVEILPVTVRFVAVFLAEFASEQIHAEDTNVVGGVYGTV